MDVAVGLDRGQVLPHRCAEVREPLGEPALTPGNWVLETGAGNVAEAVGGAGADRTQSEETITAEPELDALELVGSRACDAAPHHLAGVGRTGFRTILNTTRVAAR